MPLSGPSSTQAQNLRECLAAWGHVPRRAFDAYCERKAERRDETERQRRSRELQWRANR